ncbi:MAG: FGGY-family carbohydrate kinase [Planctomycetota bacterium]|jgi:sugar (pentulose or hexulose) kinase
MADEKYIAVIDIGKTNKKVLIYDLSLKQVDVAKKNFDEIERDGILYENLDGIWEWLQGSIKGFSSKYKIAAVSVTTHGAMAVCVGKDGEVAVPPVAYTTDAGKESDDKFYSLCGDIKSLQQNTATADVGNLINLGKLFRFTREKYPAEWENVEMILNYPQYFGFLLTGEYAAESTYVGCHTFLWNMQEGKYSDVAEKLAVKDKLPGKISKSWEVLGSVRPELAEGLGLPEDCVVTMGIHDSNSSLLPYLVQEQGDFVLNSTGTWCVVMHPSETNTFAEDELGKCVFYNMSAFFNPVKTAIFLGGLEFETYSKLLDIDVTAPEYKFNAELYAEAAAEKNFILPSVIPGAGIFPQSKGRVVSDGNTTLLADIQDGTQRPDFMNDKVKTMAVLNLSLALQTRCALDMAGYSGKGELFIEGGFRNNDSYIALLSALYPEAEVACTFMEEATAFGAAMLGAAALSGKDPDSLKDLFSIEKISAGKTAVPGIEEYSREFFRHLES